jgi:hypothetical protein
MDQHFGKGGVTNQARFFKIRQHVLHHIPGKFLLPQPLPQLAFGAGAHVEKAQGGFFGLPDLVIMNKPGQFLVRHGPAFLQAFFHGHFQGQSTGKFAVNKEVDALFAFFLGFNRGNRGHG